MSIKKMPITITRYQVIVIGGGASGMAAAIAALKEKKADVLLLESNDRVGKKLLATGNGKCNFTHKDVGAACYNTDDRAVLESVLTGFSTEDAVAFFEGLGMLSREKNGYFYPLPETASTVLDVLRFKLSELGCRIMCGIYIEKIEKREESFFVEFREQEKRYLACAGSVIVATGSKAGGFLQNRQENPLRPAKAFGLRSTPLYPALTKCICRETHYYKQLAGVRAQAGLSLYAEKDKGGFALLKQEAGELQLTKEGISGIAVFQLSGLIAQKLAEKKRVIMEIDFLPDFAEDALAEWVSERLSLLPGRSLEDFFLGVLHKKILQVCLQAEGLRGNMRIPREEADENFDGGAYYHFSEKDNYLPAGKRAVLMTSAVLKRALHFTTEVTDVSDMKQAQVCRGGLFLSQFDEKLECKTLPGLFACGEVLNVDGICGGYNLHFAWASGLLAGREAMKRAADLRTV